MNQDDPHDRAASALSSEEKAEALLTALRAQLDDADEALLRAATERQQIVARIGALKARAGRSLFDRERERRVLRGAEVKASALGLDPDLARKLMEVLVAASHRSQAALVAQAPAGAKPKILIVGGGGQMGRLFGQHFCARGCEVDVLEADDGRDRAEAARAVDVVMLAVPMHLACEVAQELGPHVRPDALLCDINSLKRDVCAVMERACAGEVLGTHPMFGPTVASLLRQKVVLCPVRPGPWGRWLEQEFGHLGLDLIQADPITHDRMMSAVQVLVHFHTIVMGEALRRAGLGVEESLRFTSPVYRLELAVVGRLFGQDPDLYAEIEMSNPFGAEVLAHFLAATQEIKQIIDAGDRDRFRAAFGHIADHFGDFRQEALALSDLLIEELVRRA